MRLGIAWREYIASNDSRRLTSTPVAVGFGIATEGQASEVARVADGVIVGSALVQRIGEAASREAALRAAREFVTGLSRAVHSARQPG